MLRVPHKPGHVYCSNFNYSKINDEEASNSEISYEDTRRLEEAYYALR